MIRLLLSGHWSNASLHKTKIDNNTKTYLFQDINLKFDFFFLVLKKLMKFVLQRLNIT